MSTEDDTAFRESVRRTLEQQYRPGTKQSLAYAVACALNDVVSVSVVEQDAIDLAPGLGPVKRWIARRLGIRLVAPPQVLVSVALAHDPTEEDRVDARRAVDVARPAGVFVRTDVHRAQIGWPR